MYSFVKFIECCYLFSAGFRLYRRIDTRKFPCLPSVYQYHTHVIACAVSRIECLAAYIDNVSYIIVAVKITKNAASFGFIDPFVR